MHKISNAILGATVQIEKGKAKKNRNIVRTLKRNLLLFKTTPDDSEFNQIFEELYNTKLGNKYINGNLLPMNICSISNYRGIDFTNNFQNEFRWNVRIFRKYSKILNEYIDVRNKVEIFILKEKYEEALEKLVSYERKYGTSIWLLEIKIFLYKKLSLDIENDIIKKCINNPALRTVLSFYKFKNDPKVGSREYNYLLHRELQEFVKRRPDLHEIAEYYQYMLESYNFKFDNSNILTLLKNVAELPLIDRYIAFIDICTYIVASNSHYTNVLKNYIYELKDIEDYTLQTICFVLDDNTANYLINNELLDIKKIFISGNLYECQEQLYKLIDKKPNDVEAICLYARIESIMGLEEDRFSVTINKIINSLSAIFSMRTDYDDCMESLYKIIMLCSKSGWAKVLNYEILINSNPFYTNQYDYLMRIKELNKLSCESIFVFKEQKWIERYYEQKNEYIVFRKALTSGDFIKASEICGLVPLQNIIDTISACYREDYNNVVKMNLNGSYDSFSVINANILWNKIDVDSCANIAVDYFVNLFIQNKMVALIMPIDKYINYYDKASEGERAQLNVIILYYIYVTYFDANRKDDLVFLCELFFMCENIEKPSKMDIYSEKYKRNQLLYFLKNICTQAIIGPILINIRTSKELDEERLEICQLLRCIDSEAGKEYEQEIKDITHKLFINEGLQTIQNSKIMVNEEGIKSRLLTDTKKDFTRLMLYRSMQIDKIYEVLGDLKNQTMIINIDSNQLFKDIIIRVRDAFVSSDEYGLEGNLSLNIRHGTLSEQLRRPLLNAELFAVYNEKNQIYIIDDRLKYKTEENSILVNSIGQLNEDTEQIIDYLKKNLIQINTEEKPTEGVFDYSMTEENFSHLLLYLKNDMQFEEYLDVIFTYLWELTERNMTIIKQRIKGEIADRYNQVFDKTRKQLAALSKKGYYADVIKRVNEAEIELQNELDTVCSWFKKSTPNQYQDFDLDIAFQIALKMIKNVHPNQIFREKCIEKSFDRKINGGFLKNYCDIFYTLFDNINKYAMPISGEISIRYKLKVEQGGIEIYIENDYDCSKNINEQELRMENARKLSKNKEYVSKAKTEGGSGIPKVCKILDFDLYKVPYIDLGINESENIFYITVKGEAKRGG